MHAKEREKKVCFLIIEDQKEMMIKALRCQLECS